MGEVSYLHIRAGLLPGKLVAREGQDAESLAAVLLVELHQLSVVGGGPASLGGDVDDDAGAAAVPLPSQVDQVPVQVDGAEGVDVPRLFWVAHTTEGRGRGHDLCAAWKSFAN